MDEVPDASVESLTKQVLAANFAANFVRVYRCFCMYVQLIHRVTDIRQCMCDR